MDKQKFKEYFELGKNYFIVGKRRCGKTSFVNELINIYSEEISDIYYLGCDVFPFDFDEKHKFIYGKYLYVIGNL